MDLQKEIISKSTGVDVQDANRQPLGKVVEVTFDDSSDQLQYLILETDLLFGRGNRYFALPVCPELIDVTEQNEIQANVNEDDLQFAKGITFEDCPKPLVEFAITIYELFNYKKSGHNKQVKAE